MRTLKRYYEIKQELISRLSKEKISLPERKIKKFVRELKEVSDEEGKKKIEDFVRSYKKERKEKEKINNLITKTLSEKNMRVSRADRNKIVNFLSGENLKIEEMKKKVLDLSKGKDISLKKEVALEFKQLNSLSGWYKQKRESRKK